MSTKTKKTNEKSNQKWSSVRIGSETKIAVEKVLKSANNKTVGRKIKPDEILCFAINLIEADHIKRLQDSSLTNEDYKELLRQFYIETRGKISKDEFIGFLMSDDFPGFKLEYLEKQKSA